MDEEALISYCGVCCSHCGMRTRVPKMAEELKRFVEAYRYGEWIAYITRGFNFQNFMNGLKWFTDSGCVGCFKSGGMPNCEVRNCCKANGLKNCYFCEDFSECAKLGYQKETYKINEHYDRIRRFGYEKWLKEQEKKLKDGFDNIRFLERRTAR